MRLAPYFAVLLVAAAAIAWALYERNATTAQRARADASQIELAGERAARTQAQDARAVENRRTARIQEALDAEHQSRQQALVDLRRADAAARSLRERAEQLAAASCPAGDPAAAAGSAPAAAPADLLSDMLGRIDEAAGEIARHADDARIAGQLCERSYAALRQEVAIGP